MIKAIVFTNHLSSLTAIDYFIAQDWLCAIVSADHPQPQNNPIEELCNIKSIPFYKTGKSDFLTVVEKIFSETKPDIALTFGFSYRIPPELYTMPSMGFFNVHFSLLPAYRGPSPVFWQLKNGEATGGITIHKIDAQFDSGPVVMRQPVQLMQGENWGMCNGKLGRMAAGMLGQLMENLIAGEIIEEIDVDDSYASYYGRALADDLVIDWDMHTAAQIECLVNACNPVYGGALTTLAGQQVYILEVTPSVVNNATFNEPGEIVYADSNYGLFVACKQGGYLRINVVQTAEGTVSVYKLIALGIKAGDSFKTFKNLETIY